MFASETSDCPMRPTQPFGRNTVQLLYNRICHTPKNPKEKSPLPSQEGVLRGEQLGKAVVVIDFRRLNRLEPGAECPEKWGLSGLSGNTIKNGDESTDRYVKLPVMGWN